MSKRKYEILTTYDLPSGYTKDYILYPNGDTRLIYTHQRVWEDYYGMRIPKGYVIHHLNHNKQDNRIQNLLILRRKLHTQVFHNVNGEGGIIADVSRAEYQLVRWYLPKDKLITLLVVD